MMSRCAARHHRLGIVGAHDPFVDALTLRTYQEAADAGLFPFRLYAFILNQWAEPLMSAGVRRGFGSEWVKIGRHQNFPGRRNEQPHGGGEQGLRLPPGAGRGILNYDQKGINREIEKFDRAGYQVSVHAQGDRALEMLLNAFERTIDRGNPLRHQIVHAGNLTPPRSTG